MIFWIFFISFLSSAETRPIEERVVGVYYFTPIFGHIHQSAVKTSPSLTTIQCSHPLKIIESSKVSVGQEWAYVQVADYKGFVYRSFLSEKRPSCLQGKYPKFFDAFNLDLAELYYWGRLSDHFIQGVTRVK
jgi:hypothetical protein